MVKVVKKITKGDVTKTILEMIKFSSVISIALVAPNALQIFGKRGFLNIHDRQKDVINNARDRLIKNGFLQKNPDGFLELTEKGDKKLQSCRLSDYELIIPRIWDKKWRVLVFDISEDRKSLRDKVRHTLVSIGFIHLQDSVWIFPYDCEELVALLKADFKIGKDLLYMVVEKIENDYAIRKMFGLHEKY